MRPDLAERRGDTPGPPPPFRLLVTGSERYTDADTVRQVLGRALARHPGLVLVVGGRQGLDTLARRWAAEHGVPVDESLQTRPHACIDFAGDRFAAALVQRAVNAGIKTDAVSIGCPRHHLEPGQLVWW